MESPGEHLKRERESRGFTLKKVFEVTRVPLKYLESIESDDYENLPQPAFVKGYIKAYCKFLGIDDNDSVLRFELYLKEKSGRAYELTPLPNAADKRPQQIPSCYLKWIASGLAALGIIAVVVIYTAKHSGKQSAQPVAQAEPAAALEPKAAQPEVAAQSANAAPTARAKVPQSSSIAGGSIPPAQTPATAAKPIVGLHKLDVKASEDTWIKLTIDNAAEPIDVLLRAGEAVSWKADTVFSLVIGNAGGVELALDGAPVGPLGGSGSVVSIKLPRSGESSGQAVKTPIKEIAAVSDKKEARTESVGLEKSKPEKPVDGSSTAGQTEPAVEAPKE